MLATKPYRQPPWASRKRLPPKARPYPLIKTHMYLTFKVSIKGDAIQSIAKTYKFWMSCSIFLFSSINQIRLILSSSHINMCTFHFQPSHIICAFQFMESYPNLLPLYIKLFTTHTTIKIPKIFWTHYPLTLLWLPFYSSLLLLS